MRRSGFTLLETLVALAVTALVLAALGRLVLQTASARTQATAASERLGGARAVLVGLAREIEAALPPGAPGATTPSESFVVVAPATPGASSQLRFAAAVAPATPGTADVQTLAYAVPARSTTLTRTRRGARDGLPVVEGVRRFTVRCFDGATWHDTWAAGALPRAVAVRLELIDEPTPLATTVTVMAAGR